jgi:outer membrane protein OmpA-like peptidoglycan-associated protein
MRIYSIVLPVSGVLLAACASAPPASLVDARAAYQRASQSEAKDLTPAQLHTAERSLAIAEKTYEDEGASANARDRAYVAMRKAELAQVQAGIVSAERATALAAQRVETAKERQQAATQSSLDTTQAQLVDQKNVVANQKSQLAVERQRAQDAERRAADAMAALASIATVKQETRGTVITLSGAVVFASGQSELLPGASAKLDQVATALSQSDPKTQIVVEGHTDSRGSAEMNQNLSNARAEKVRGYLVSKGVAAERIVSQGVGPSRPVADNETAEGRANNRRVEIIVKAAQSASAPVSSSK